MMTRDEPQPQEFEGLDHAERNDEDEQDDGRGKPRHELRQRVFERFERDQGCELRQTVAETIPQPRFNKEEGRENEPQGAQKLLDQRPIHKMLSIEPVFFRSRLSRQCARGGVKLGRTQAPQSGICQLLPGFSDLATRATIISKEAFAAAGYSR